MKYFFIIILYIITLDQVSGCRLWAVINKENLTLSTLSNSEQYEIRSQLSTFFDQSVNMTNGWSLLDYTKEYSVPIVPLFRSEKTAYSDSTIYWSLVDSILDVGASSIALGHLRLSSSGINTTPNPHPWMFYHNGISYSFMHNGTVNKNILYNLITQNGTDLSWLDNHQPTTFNGTNWKEEGWSNVIDSELLMLYIMQKVIQEESIFLGLQVALSTIISNGIYAGQMNLIFSDGSSLFIFGGEEGLSFKESSEYYSIMTEPDSDDYLSWSGISEGELIIFNHEGFNEYPNFIYYKDENPLLPTKSATRMSPAFPNPFNSSINFSFLDIAEGEPVDISIFNLKGLLIDHFQLKDTEEKQIITWNPVNSISSGTYFIQANINNIILNQKIVFIK